MNAGYAIVGGVVVVLLLIPAAWLLVLRLADRSEIGAGSGGRDPVRGSSTEPPQGLGQAKDRNAARTWDPER